MDRGKTASGRGSKSKTPQFPSDLYVLGPKGARTEGNESKRPVPVHTKTGPSHSLAGTLEFFCTVVYYFYISTYVFSFR